MANGQGRKKKKKKSQGRAKDMGRKPEDSRVSPNRKTSLRQPKNRERKTP
jgi:hypothetical protein